MNDKVSFTLQDYLVLGSFLLGNLFYSITKCSLSTSMPTIKSQLSASKVDIGNISSQFSLSYGVSKLVGGFLSDIFPAYLIFIIGLTLGSVVNIAVAHVRTVRMIGMLWMLNGMGQGIGVPALSLVVLNHFHKSTTGTIWSSLTFTCNLGYLISPALLIPILDRHGWTGPFIACGIGGMLCCIAMSGICFTCLKSSHGTLLASSESSIDTDSAVTGGAASKQIKATDNIKEGKGSSRDFQLLKCAVLMISNMLTYFVFKGMYDWTGLFLIERLQVNALHVWELMLWNEVGGIVGSLTVGHLSDALHNKKCLACLLFTLCCLAGFCSMFLFIGWSDGRPSASAFHQQLCLNDQQEGSTTCTGLWDSSSPYTWMVNSSYSTIVSNEIVSGAILRMILFVVGFGINGPKTLLVIDLMELIPKRFSGSLCGLVGLLSQIGASFSGTYIALHIESSGWGAYLNLLILTSSILCVLLFVITFMLS